VKIIASASKLPAALLEVFLSRRFRTEDVMHSQNKSIWVAVSDLFFYTKIRDALRQDYTLERMRGLQEIAKRASGERPSAMILNLNEDTFDAFQAVSEIKAQDSLKSIPILAFANHEEVDAWKRAKELGVNKIVSRNEFSSRTRALVDELIGPGTQS
jgi:PleD family two-component response regulator